MSGASITANTIPPAAINGGINVSLPTTSMTARTATQVGYQIFQNQIPSAMWQNNACNATVPITNVTGLSPTGSVWIIQYNIDFWGSGLNNVYRVQHGALNGTALLSNGGNYITNCIGGVYNANSGPSFNNNSCWIASGVIVSDATHTVTVSCYLQGTTGGNYKAQSAYLTATRIA